MNAILANLKVAADLANPALKPGPALQAMAAVDGLEAFDADDAFQATYSALRGEVIATALTQFALVEEELQRLSAAGNFDAVRTLMTDLIGRMDLPTFREGQAPAPGAPPGRRAPGIFGRGFVGRDFVGRGFVGHDPTQNRPWISRAPRCN